MPEWSKGVDLRSTVFARGGSNPPPGRSLTDTHSKMSRTRCNRCSNCEVGIWRPQMFIENYWDYNG